MRKMVKGFNIKKVKIFELQQQLYKRQFSLKEAGIDSGLFTFWRKNGLIDFVDDNKWARLSFLQLIWVKLLISLREFGMPLEKLKKVHEYFFIRAYKDEFAKHYYEELAKQISENIKNGVASDVERHGLKVIQESLKNKGLMDIHNRDFNYFSNLVGAFLNKREEAGILIYGDGSITEFFDNEYYQYDDGIKDYKRSQNKPEFDRPHIFISLPYYLVDFLNNEAFIDYMPSLNILNEDELLVIKEMRRSNVVEIRVKLKDGKMRRMESDTTGNLSEAEMLEIINLVGLQNYQSIIFYTRNEKTVSFVRTKKIIK